MAEAIGCVQSIPCDEEAGQVGHQFPVVHKAARQTKELPFLRQKFGAGPADAIALEHMFRGIEACFGKVFIDRDVGFAFLTNHHSPDDFSLQLRHARQVGVEGEFVAHFFQFFIGQSLRTFIFVLRLLNIAAFHEKALAFGRIEAGFYIGKDVAIPVDIGNFFSFGIYQCCRVPSIMIVSCAVRRE